ncbi:MAG: succinylglutamate desuccinylase/aspartoacylase family protein [Planctomycetes bacterium]|nr:succinylglutamate desuccinylase/aspartoacylase family protein [Planctomycetota bacterium]
MNSESQGLSGLKRVLGDLPGARPGGPLCVVTAGIHGNEPAGVHALRRVFATIAQGKVPLQGRFVALCGNIAGLERNARFISEDMNRVWSKERVSALRASDPARDNSEQREQRDMLAHIDADLDDPHGKVTHLDLHSTSSIGPPFTVIAGPGASRAAANHLGVPLLLGLDSVIGGTLIEHMGNLGHSTVLIEGGQNDAPSTIDHHESAVWLTLEFAGVVRSADIPELDALKARLLAGADGLPHELEIGYRHRLEPEEEFRMLPGYSNFDDVVEGQLLARSGPGFEIEVRAPWTGTLLMPRYQGQGLDGFFLGRRSTRAG